MFGDSRHEPAARRATVSHPARPALLVAVLAALVLALAAVQAFATNTHPTLVQPAATGQARAARQAVLKQRAATVPQSARKPGKTVGGTSTPHPKTITTKRNLPK
jgi:hypothetical protein